LLTKILIIAVFVIGHATCLSLLAQDQDTPAPSEKTPPDKAAEGSQKPDKAPEAAELALPDPIEADTPRKN